MDRYERMYWELYTKIGQVIEELEAARADTERIFLQEALKEENTPQTKQRSLLSKSRYKSVNRLFRFFYIFPRKSLLI